jgi:D-glycero-D-manno-heptose 1,7-bisphosphate phosphatase
MHEAKAKRPVVFFDRDGTLNVEKGYLRKVEDLVLIEGAGLAVKRLNQAGVAAVLVSNQSGAARKFYPLSHIEALNERLAMLLKQEGAHLDAVYYCPHLPEGEEQALAIACDCRKPLPGLVERAFAEHPDLDRALSFVIGDKTNDLGLANSCGARCILVKTGYGQSLIESGEHSKFKIDLQAESAVQAVDWILSEIGQHRPR